MEPDNEIGIQGAPADKPRRRPGSRRLEILQMLASMLEEPNRDKVTTAALAARLGVSEAALYRHFASKAQMFEGLIEFIESTVFALINDVGSHEESGLRQFRYIVRMLLEFPETNRGMTRVLMGDALVNEHDRLQERMNQFIDRVEASLRQALRVAITQNELPAGVDATARAALAIAYIIGRWQRYAKGAFRRSPSEGLDAHLAILLQA